MKTFCFVVATLLSTACGSNGAETPEKAMGDEALVAGTPTSRHPEIGRVQLTRVAILGDHADTDKQTWCTGTLVTPDVVLTARGCRFADLLANGGSFFVDSDKKGDGKQIETTRFVIDAIDRIDHRANAATEQSEFLFIHLKAPVPASLAKPLALRSTPIRDQERVRAFGYTALDPDVKARAKDSVAFSFHYDELDENSPAVMEAGADLGCAVLDAEGRLAAVGYSRSEKGWLFGHPDFYAEPGRVYETITSFIRDFERRSGHDSSPSR